MPHLTGVLEDRKGDCCISLDEMMGFYCWLLEQNYKYRRCEAFAVIFMDVELPCEIM